MKLSDNAKFGLGMLAFFFGVALLTECDDSVPRYDMIDCEVEYWPSGPACV